MARMFELAEDDGQRDDEGAVALPDLLVDRYSQRLVGLIINRYGIGIVSQGVEGVLPSVVGPNAQLKIVLFQQDARLGDNAQIVSLEIIVEIDAGDGEAHAFGIAKLGIAILYGKLPRVVSRQVTVHPLAAPRARGVWITVCDLGSRLHGWGLARVYSAASTSRQISRSACRQHSDASGDAESRPSSKARWRMRSACRAVKSSRQPK